MWERLWMLPQAVEWERMQCADIVALYVRTFIAASDEADPKLSAEVRQLDAKIGLSPKAMRDLRWETDEAAEAEEAPAAEPALPAPPPKIRAYVPAASS